ncbi:MAG: hypothetical protein M0Q90_08795 [Bacteroidales bacterium]|nr:hypothetical protein [Bacteroidales bacterium]
MENLIIFLGIVAAFVLPIVIMQQKKKRKIKKKIEEVSLLAQQNGSALGQHEVEHKVLIGLSENGGHVFYYPFKHKDMEIQMVPLEGVKNCRVNVEGHAVSYGGESRQVTDKIELLFLPKEKLKQTHSLRLYNSDQDGLQLNGQNMLADKWAKIINQTLEKNSKK